MEIEYEATFPNINKNDIRQRLKNAKAKLIRPEFLQKRVTFNPPKGHEIKGGWFRVRDEGDKVTMSIKIVIPGKIEDQKEIQVEVDDFDKAVQILLMAGCDKKAFQETKRELWELGGVVIAIDEWPWLEPFVEVEGDSEEVVKQVSKQLGFNYKDVLFCSVETLYSQKYGVSEESVCNDIPRIVFNEPNPFN